MENRGKSGFLERVGDEMVDWDGRRQNNFEQIANCECTVSTFR